MHIVSFFPTIDAFMTIFVALQSNYSKNRRSQEALMHLDGKSLMVFILPPILVPFWAQIFALMVDGECQIGDIIALGKKVLFIKSLDLEEGFH